MSLLDRATLRDGARWLQVAPEQWRDVHSEAREMGYPRCEWVTAVDIGQLEVVSHLTGDAGLLVLRTKLVGDTCDAIDDIYVSASYHQREVAQMFGTTFVGARDVSPAFEAEFDGNPLRRHFVLRPRVDHVWPGADEATARRPTPVPGIHPEWRA